MYIYIIIIYIWIRTILWHVFFTWGKWGFNPGPFKLKQRSRHAFLTRFQGHLSQISALMFQKIFWTTETQLDFWGSSANLANLLCFNWSFAAEIGLQLFQVVPLVLGKRWSNMGLRGTACSGKTYGPMSLSGPRHRVTMSGSYLYRWSPLYDVLFFIDFVYVRIYIWLYMIIYVY